MSVLLQDFISVISGAPNIEEMLLDERFDVKLMYGFYTQWMNKHHPGKRVIKEHQFLKEMNKAYNKLNK